MSKFKMLKKVSYKCSAPVPYPNGTECGLTFSSYRAIEKHMERDHADVVKAMEEEHGKKE